MINLKKFLLIHLISLILPSFYLLAQASTATNRTTNNEIEQYGLFETEFAADSAYNNPYVEVSFSAHVAGPGGMAFDVEGYWAGSNSWRLRIMPTIVGQWTYITQSNDPGLDSLSGAFDCIASSRSGVLMINPDYPYTFKLSEGPPFLWMGETNWCLMSNAVPYDDGTFQKYINKRLEQKFNGIHFVLGTGGLPHGTKNPQNEGGNLWISQRDQRINPEFFNWVDKRFAYLDSMQMAVGFFVTWSQHFTTFTRDEFERFERYLIARYAAFPLLYWVIVGEYDEAGAIEDYNYHGTVLYNRDPYGHLISNHPDHNDPQNLGTSRIFAGQHWFTFILQQLPQYPVFVSPADVNQSILIDRVYDLPVVNDEFGYEGKDYYGKVVTSDWVRKYAWAIMLGGGFFSYGHDKTVRTIDLTALETAGVNYVSHLYDFFKDLNWWEMNPENIRVDNGFCLAGPSSKYIIYLPDSGGVMVDLTMDSGLLMASWYNPINGTYSDTLVIQGGGFETFTSPYQDDAVLYLFPNIKPIIQVQPDTLLFKAMERAANPQDQTITVTNTGGGIMNWSVTIQPDVPWLKLNPTSGGSEDQITVSIDISNQTAATYYDTIRISDPNALNNPVNVPVTLTVDSLVYITVVSPNGGEAWEVNSVHEIQWQSQKTSATVMIEYSIDNGTNWILIDSSAINDHHYSWSIPNYPATACLVKITDTAGEPFDWSDSLFTIAEPLNAEFIGEPETGIKPLTVTFSDQSTGLIDSWHWDFGDGATSTSQNPIHRYPAVGIYSVTLSVTGATGQDSETRLNYIKVFDKRFIIPLEVSYFNQWRFKPDSAIFDLQADTTVNFQTFLSGDVNGDWNAVGSPDQKDSGSGNLKDSTTTILKISDIKTSGSKEISVPILAKQLEAPLYTLILTVEYNPQVLSYLSVSETTLNHQFMIAENDAEPGKVHLALAAVEAMNKDGEITTLSFSLKPMNFEHEYTELKICRAWINDKSVVNIVNGRIYFNDTVLENIPKRFAIFQNQPNPFNQSTKICFDLPGDATVALKIFNVLGQKVTTLLNRSLPAGRHQINWNGADELGKPLNSGIYFYQIKVEQHGSENGKSYAVMKKMFLLK